MTKPKTHKRFWEIDVWRGVAVILMIIYHVIIMWMALHAGRLILPAWPYQVIARIASTSFLLLVGLSAYISNERRLAVNQDWSKITAHFYQRGAIIFGWGLIISVLSYVFLPEATIVFGILHLIGVTLFFMPLILRSKFIRYLLILLSGLAIFYTFQVGTDQVPRMFIGIFDKRFSTLDYWPLFPWITISIIGVELGERLYPHGRRKFHFREKNFSNLSLHKLTETTAYIGRHALLIYLLHVPISLFIFWLYFSVTGG